MTLSSFPPSFDKRSTNTDVIHQLLYPDTDGTWGVIDLTSMIITEQGRGMSPLHYNVQRGTYQHGETPVSIRLDPRTIQVVLAMEHDSRSQMYDNLAILLKRLSPQRNWSATSGSVTHCVYRKIMPGGRLQWRGDLATSAGGKHISSYTARFCEWGLNVGDPFYILTGADAGEYTVEHTINETSLALSQNMTATVSGANGNEYRVFTSRVIRDLNVLIETGPTLEDDHQEDSLSMNDTIRLVAHDPLWRNPILQWREWEIKSTPNLIFYESPDWEDRAVFPIWFASDAISVSSDIMYLGTWYTRPTIVIDGPFSEFELENASTGHKLDLAYDAAVGEQVTINLDALTVTNNFGQSLMRYMSTPYANTDSDLVTFGIYPDPQVKNGYNRMNVFVYGGQVGNTAATLYWYSRYIGV